jgi:hypothetical protein
VQNLPSHPWLRQVYADPCIVSGEHDRAAVVNVKHSTLGEDPRVRVRAHAGGPLKCDAKPNRGRQERIRYHALKRADLEQSAYSDFFSSWGAFRTQHVRGPKSSNVGAQRTERSVPTPEKTDRGEGRRQILGVDGRVKTDVGPGPCTAGLFGC